MNEGINLLGKVSIQNQNNVALILRYIAISMLCLVATLSVLFFFLRSQSSLPLLQEEEGALLGQLGQQNIKVAKHFFIKDRLINAQKIIATRPDLEKKLILLKKDVGGGLILSNLSISETQYSLTVDSTSLVAMHTYIETLEKELSKDPLFKTVTIDNVSYDKQISRYSTIVRGNFQ